MEEEFVVGQIKSTTLESALELLPQNPSHPSIWTMMFCFETEFC
jgi:hypothetical protein